MSVTSQYQRICGAWVALAAVACGGDTAPPATPAPQVDAGPQITSDVRDATRYITESNLKGHIRYLAHDLLEGRAPGSPGDQMTRLYLASQLERMGYLPGAPNNRWEQPFDLVGITAEVPDTWRFRGVGRQSITFNNRRDFIAASGIQARAATVKDAEVVFVGYGIEAPEYEWNDYKNVDVRGKVIVMLNNDPDWDPKLFEGDRRLYYGRWTYKYEIAAKKGAVGAIIIHTTASAGYPWKVVDTSWTGEQFELVAGAEARIQVAGWLTEDAATQLVRLGGYKLEDLMRQAKSPAFTPVPLQLKTSLKLTNALRRVKSANVIGVLPGSDPGLRDQAVVYTAHFDHLGVGEPNTEGDRIYNGALDNASGVAQVLTIAESLAGLPAAPRRSSVILFVAAEEQGLLGAKYFTANPTFPAGKIAANINYDGGNIWGPTQDITYIGYGKSSLDRVVEKVANHERLAVQGDQFPDKGYFYRSDQLAFARIGVPAIYLDMGTRFVGRDQAWGKKQVDTWVGRHYHQPSDELTPRWNFEGMVNDTRFGFYCGVLVGNATPMPTWNPGDEFEAARKRALQAL